MTNNRIFEQCTVLVTGIFEVVLEDFCAISDTKVKSADQNFKLERSGMSQVLISSCLFVIAPCALGAIASFFFFIRKDNRKICISLIAITSVWGILRTVMTNYAIIRSTDQFLSMYLSTRAILSIAIYGLILYQTFTLDKKRKNAIEVSEVS